MLLKPREGFLYRHPRTRELVPADGFDANPSDLDIDRARKCGDLVEATAPAKPAASKAAKAAQAGE